MHSPQILWNLFITGMYFFRPFYTGPKSERETAMKRPIEEKMYKTRRLARWLAVRGRRRPDPRHACAAHYHESGNQIRQAQGPSESLPHKLPLYVSRAVGSGG